MPTRPLAAKFIEPMFLVRSDSLPEGANWAYELKRNGYRAIGVKTVGAAHLRSREQQELRL